MISIDEIKKTLHELDLIYRPYALICSPADKERIGQIIKGTEVEDRVKVQELPFAEDGKVYVMKREDLESWSKPWANNDFGYTWSDLE